MWTKGVPVVTDVVQVEDCLYMTDQIDKWQKDVKKRIQSLNEAISSLHTALEMLDDAHSSGNLFVSISVQSAHKDKNMNGREGGAEKKKVVGGKDAEQLKRELEEAKKLIKEKDNMLARTKRAYDEKAKKLEEKKGIGGKGKELDEE
ncbi:CTA2 subfamily 1 protein 7, partial [Reticulomyxa filosa]